MTSTTQFIPTPELSIIPGLSPLGLPMAAAKSVYGGALVCLDASGNLVDGADATAVDCAGVANKTIDNSAGAAAAKYADVNVGVFGFTNGDSITKADAGKLAFISDNRTVKKAPSTLGIPCGRIVMVDPNSGLVFVSLFSPWNRPQIIFTGTATLASGTVDIQVPQLKATSRIVTTLKDKGAGSIADLAAISAPEASRIASTGIFTVNAINGAAGAVITTAVCTFDWAVYL